MEPVGLVMGKVLAAARDKALGRKAQAMAEAMELVTVVALSS